MTQHETTSKYRMVQVMVALVPIILVFGLLNVGLGVVWGPAPAKLLQSELTDADSLQAIAERVATVENQWQEVGSMHVRLAVVTGLSTAREGIDPIQIYKETKGGVRLLNISSSGGSFSEMRTYSEPLLNSSLQPDLVIMAVHPCWLAGRQLRTSPQSESVSRESGKKVSTETDFQQLRGWVAQQLWVLNNRRAIHSELRQFMLEWRARIHYLTNISSIEPSREGDYPWSVQIAYRDQQAPPEFLQAQLRAWASTGWFDPGRFGTHSAESQSLRLFINLLRDKTSNLVIVLMPESEEFRSQVPLSAAETLMNIVQSVDRGISVLDLRASLPDAMFRDHAHLNSQGRLALSREFTGRFFVTP